MNVVREIAAIQIPLNLVSQMTRKNEVLQLAKCRGLKDVDKLYAIEQAEILFAYAFNGDLAKQYDLMDQYAAILSKGDASLATAVRNKTNSSSTQILNVYLPQRNQRIQALNQPAQAPAANNPATTLAQARAAAAVVVARGQAAALAIQARAQAAAQARQARVQAAAAQAQAQAQAAAAVQAAADAAAQAQAQAQARAQAAAAQLAADQAAQAAAAQLAADQAHNGAVQNAANAAGQAQDVADAAAAIQAATDRVNRAQIQEQAADRAADEANAALLAVDDAGAAQGQQPDVADVAAGNRNQRTIQGNIRAAANQQAQARQEVADAAAALQAANDAYQNVVGGNGLANVQPSANARMSIRRNKTGAKMSGQRRTGDLLSTLQNNEAVKYAGQKVSSKEWTLAEAQKYVLQNLSATEKQMIKDFKKNKGNPEDADQDRADYAGEQIREGKWDASKANDYVADINDPDKGQALAQVTDVLEDHQEATAGILDSIKSVASMSQEQRTKTLNDAFTKLNISSAQVQMASDLVKKQLKARGLPSNVEEATKFAAKKAPFPYSLAINSKNLARLQDVYKNLAADQGHNNAIAKVGAMFLGVDMNEQQSKWFTDLCVKVDDKLDSKQSKRFRELAEFINEKFAAHKDGELSPSEQYAVLIAKASMIDTLDPKLIGEKDYAMFLDILS